MTANPIGGSPQHFRTVTTVTELTGKRRTRSMPGACSPDKMRSLAREDGLTGDMEVKQMFGALTPDVRSYIGERWRGHEGSMVLDTPTAQEQAAFAVDGTATVNELLEEPSRVWHKPAD